MWFFDLITQNTHNCTDFYCSNAKIYESDMHWLLYMCNVENHNNKVPQFLMYYACWTKARNEYILKYLIYSECFNLTGKYLVYGIKFIYWADYLHKQHKTIHYKKIEASHTYELYEYMDKMYYMEIYNYQKCYLDLYGDMVKYYYNDDYDIHYSYLRNSRDLPKYVYDMDNLPELYSLGAKCKK